jgi:hypothetical protein
VNPERDLRNYGTDTARHGTLLRRPGAPRSGGETLLLGTVVVLDTILTILAVTIVNVAVPTLGAEFGTSISTIQWVTGYVLAFASVIPGQSRCSCW